MEEERVYYEHDMGCESDDLEEIPDSGGLMRCDCCAGIFDSDNKGLALTDKRFDEDEPKPR